MNSGGKVCSGARKKPEGGKQCVWVVLLVLVLASTVQAKEYRIATQAAFDTYRRFRFRPGDRIFFKRGVAFTGMFSPSGSGASDAPIVVKPYGTGALPRIHAGGRFKAGIFLKNMEYWEIEGIEITNTDGSDGDQGRLFGIYVLVEDPGPAFDPVFEHVHLCSCYIHHVNGKVAGKGRGGIHVQVKGARPAKFHDLRIAGNRIHCVGGVGIGNSSPFARCDPEKPLSEQERTYAWTRVHVAGNFIKHTGRNSIIARSSDNAVYEYNVLAESSRYSTGHSIFCFHTIGIVIQYNEAYGNLGAGGKDRGGFDADYNCLNTLIQYNYSHDNLWFCGIMKRPNRNVVIRYNISSNDREGLYFYGFDRNSEAKNIHIYNNTHYVGKKYDVEVFCEGRTPVNTVFENNIFYFEGKGQWGKHPCGKGVKFSNNLYYNITPHPTDSHALTADPRLVAPGASIGACDMKTRTALKGFYLEAASPCRLRGRFIRKNGGRDFFGGALPEGRPDIGAHQRQRDRAYHIMSPFTIPTSGDKLRMFNPKGPR